MFGVVYITCPNKEEAKRIGKELIQLKLAACSNIIASMESQYIWNGGFQNESEVVLLLKTRADLFEGIEKKVIEIHTYECPCIFLMPIQSIGKAYANWLNEQLL